MAQPMDPKRYDLVGESFPVVEKVGSVLALGFFAVSANGVLAYRSGATMGTVFAQLSWYDRSGKLQDNLVPGPAYTGTIQLSPDGKRAAVEQTDNMQNRDIWIVDIVRRASTRFTFESANDRQPVWSPDGSQLIFSSDRESIGSFQLYRKASNGSGAEESLLKTVRGFYGMSWAPDGRHLLYESNDAKTQFDLWVLPIAAGGAPGTPFPYLQTPAAERQGQFSPDGRWIVYTSDESAPGQFQIYVQSFPAGAGKFQISTGSGGTQPRWRRDGKEIFFASADAKLMAAEVRTTPRFESGTPKALFDPRWIPAAGGGATAFRYDVSPDGNRFLVVTPATGLETNGSTPITVVLNWTAAVRR